jgi:hypothetical protein
MSAFLNSTAETQQNQAKLHYVVFLNSTAETQQNTD